MLRGYVMSAQNEIGKTNNTLTSPLGLFWRYAKVADSLFTFLK